MFGGDSGGCGWWFVCGMAWGDAIWWFVFHCFGCVLCCVVWLSGGDFVVLCGGGGLGWWCGDCEVVVAVVCWCCQWWWWRFLDPVGEVVAMVLLSEGSEGSFVILSGVDFHIQLCEVVAMAMAIVRRRRDGDDCRAVVTDYLFG